MKTQPRTDIKPDHLFIRILPSALRPYGRLARLDRPIGVWLLLLPGWWAIVLAAGGVIQMNAHDWQVFSLFALGALVMRSAGCIINDLWDRDLDRKVERTQLRPLASGEISPRSAFLFLNSLLFCGLLILSQLNLVTVLLGVISLPLIAAYPLMKRITWWPQAFLGLTFNFSALMGWSAVTGALSLPALILYISGIFWTLGYDTIYAHQDKEDDMLAGIKSSALKLGERSKQAECMFYSVHFVLLLLAVVLASGWSWGVLLLAVPAAFIVYHIRIWQPDKPETALRAFKSSRDYGLIILLIVALTAI